MKTTEQVDIPYSAYAELPGVRWSSLRHLDDSPAHFREAIANPRPQTPSMLVGTIVHGLVLGGGPELAVYDGPTSGVAWDLSRRLRAGDTFQIFDGRRAGKVWEAFQLEHEGNVIVRRKDYDEALAIAEATAHITDTAMVVPSRVYSQATAIAAAVMRHPGARDRLDGAACEKSVQWVDEIDGFGLPCKARLDAVTTGGVLVDLKTTRTTHERAFGSAAARYGYHGQLAHYRAGWRACTGVDVGAVEILAVETASPYDVAIFTMSPEDLAAGEEWRQRLLRKYVDCMRTGDWHGRYPDPVPLRLPSYVLDGSDEITASADEVTE